MSEPIHIDPNRTAARGDAADLTGPYEPQQPSTVVVDDARAPETVRAAQEINPPRQAVRPLDLPEVPVLLREPNT